MYFLPASGLYYCDSRSIFLTHTGSLIYGDFTLLFLPVEGLHYGDFCLIVYG